jgi:tetratricopeptide (TPR) repeat protein
MRRALAVPATLLAAVLAAAPADAQRAYRRPELPRGADPNDWEAYYRRGAELLQGGLERQAEAAFHWASRLNPTRGEPLYGMRVAIFVFDTRRWLRYVDGSEQVMRDPEVQRADSLLAEAFARNPFTPPTLDVLLYDRISVRWANDLATQGWLHYLRGNPEQAARSYERLVASDPRGHAWRYELALVQVELGRLDSAAAQVRALLAEPPGREKGRPGAIRMSRERLEYALGMLYVARRRYPEARQAFGRAIAENPAAYTGHRGMGVVALAEGKSAEAAGHFARAVELAGERPLVSYECGRALLAAVRPAEAVPYLARAVAGEPHWPEAHLELARAYDEARNTAEALKEYERYLELAPRSEASTVNLVRQRMENLRAVAGAP